MAVADGGDLIILAPGVKSFGENEEMDQMTRTYGYKGRDYILELFRKGVFENRIMAADHLIQGSSDGRFRITYCTRPDSIRNPNSPFSICLTSLCFPAANTIIHAINSTTVVRMAVPRLESTC